MRNVRFPLSWKLTLCSILMMLLMWTAVGAVLVMSTAEEIMEAQDDEAQRRADMVMQYGGVDTIGYYYRLDQGDHWIEEARTAAQRSAVSRGKQQLAQPLFPVHGHPAHQRGL